MKKVVVAQSVFRRNLGRYLKMVGYSPTEVVVTYHNKPIVRLVKAK